MSLVPKLTLKHSDENEQDILYFPITQSVPDLTIYSLSNPIRVTAEGHAEWYLFNNKDYKPPLHGSIFPRGDIRPKRDSPDTDTVKSVKLLQYEIVIYENTDYKGRFMTLYGDVSNLDDVNFQHASSVRVIFGNWLLYDGTKYAGNNISITRGNHNFNSSPPVRYLSMRLAEIVINDSEGHPQIILHRDVENLSDIGIDIVPSIRVVYGNWALFQGVGYAGISAFYKPGSHHLDNQMISSVQLAI